MQKSFDKSTHLNHKRPTHTRGPFVKLLYVGAGHLCLILATIGILLPLLPTTPFLLLAAGAYLRGSEPLHHWLLNHRVLGTYIRNYYEGKGIPKRLKISLIVMVWLSIGISAHTLVPLLSIKILLILIAAAVTIFLWRLPTTKIPAHKI